MRKAGQSGDPAAALEAWEFLCRAYWKPVYAYIRRLGNPTELAKDLTQGFFFHLLRRERIKWADSNVGKFRSFLLGSLNRFMHSEWDRRIAQKRDERLVVSLDQTDGEGDLMIEPAAGLPPDRCFERDWAASLLRRVRQRLIEDLNLSGKDIQLALMPSALYEADGPSYQVLARDLGISEDRVKKTVQRLRERWGTLLREEVLATVSDPSEVEAEIRYLLQVVES